MAGAYLPVSSQDVDEAVTKRDHPAGNSVAHMATTTLKVEGMTCGACTSAVESGFKGVGGVGKVSVSLVMERAVVTHDPARLSAEKVKEIIEDRGFDAEILSSDVPETREEVSSSSVTGDAEKTVDAGLATTTVQVEGMTCGACTSAVEGAFKNVAGVKSFSISLLSGRAVLEHDPVLLSPERIAEIIDDSGFDAKILSTEAVIPASIGDTSRSKSSQAQEVSTTVSIDGMTCGACTSAVEAGFGDLQGLVSFSISLLAERAVITHDPSKLSADKIVEIIEDRGFDARIVSSQVTASPRTSAASTVLLKLYGLVNATTASDLESHLRQLPGVTAATITFPTSRASITHKPTIIGLRAIVEAIEAAGYNALLADTDDNNAQLESLSKTKEIQSWRTAFYTSLYFAIPVFLTSMFFPMFIPFLDYGSIALPVPGLWLGDVVCLILTIPVQFGIGKRFYISAFRSLRHGSPTMDVLVILGTSTAFFFSIAAMLVSVLTPPHSKPSTLFDTSTMLITFICLGRYLENKAKGQTSKALSRLMSLAPSMATIYADPIAAAKAAESWGKAMGIQEKASGTAGGTGANTIEERVVPTELIQVDDIVIIKPGDKIPADGTVTRGESYVDESMVTGEAMPLLKQTGSLLMAGTVNGAGRLDFRVTRAGRDTQLSQIVRLVQEAQTSRAPIQHMADIVAGYFVPVIICLGLITFVSWMVLSHALPDPPAIFLHPESGGKFMVCLKLCISVIVFACPCALGLSTPTAVMVGTGVGAEQGILVKGGAALETATKITDVLLDKTGTLTEGKMSVANADIVAPNQGEDPASFQRLWWTLIGLTEMGSEHPIGKAIVNAAKENLGISADGSFDGSTGDFVAEPGKGVSALVEPVGFASHKRHQVLIGNASYLRSHNVKIPSEYSEETRALDSPLSLTNTVPAPTGSTTILTALDGDFTGTLHLSDTLKPTATPLIVALRHLRITAHMVTGDSLTPALHVGAQIGIPPSHIHASMTPAAKRDLVHHLQARGKKVAFVGDGVNDSPALAASNTGIALSTGTDVAMEAADVVLMQSGTSSSSDLLAIPASLLLSRTVMRRIKMNLGWATGYNVIGLPFAMGILLPWGWSLPPMAAGAAMACSSLSVVGSSLALKWWTRPRWLNAGNLEAEAKSGTARTGSRSRRADILGVVKEWVGGRKRMGEAERGLMFRCRAWARTTCKHLRTIFPFSLFERRLSG